MGTLDSSGVLWTTEPSTVTTDSSEVQVPTTTITGQCSPLAQGNATATPQPRTGTVVGLAVGIPLGILTVTASAVAFFFLGRLRKERSRQFIMQDDKLKPRHDMVVDQDRAQLRDNDAKGQVEADRVRVLLDDDGARVQLGDDGARYELEAFK